MQKKSYTKICAWFRSYVGKDKIKNSEIAEIITKLEREAEKRYALLKPPRFYNKEQYISIWIQMWAIKRYSKDKIDSFRIKDLPPLFHLPLSYYVYVANILPTYRKKLYSEVDKCRRRKIWNSFKLDQTKIQEALQAKVKVENMNAEKKGYKNIIDRSLLIKGIPSSLYGFFLNHYVRVIDYCNNQLSLFNKLPKCFFSEFNKPCFLCVLTDFPLKDREDVFTLVASEYPEIKDFEEKIKIIKGQESKMHYDEKRDIIIITIDKTINRRHEFTDLLHEFCHVVALLKFSKRGLNPLLITPFDKEKEALKIEFDILKRFLPEVYRSRLGDVLLCFWENLFLINLYSKPDQDLSELYARIFNLCFRRKNQKTNPTYILEKGIVENPFSNLIHAVSYFTILSDQKNEK